MKKLITVIALLFTMFTLSAYPKYTMLDYNCGNTPEYTAKFVELDTTKKISSKHSKYLGHLRKGTWVIDYEDGQKLYVSYYNDKIIACGYVKRLLINYEENGQK